MMSVAEHERRRSGLLDTVRQRMGKRVEARTAALHEHVTFVQSILSSLEDTTPRKLRELEQDAVAHIPILTAYGFTPERVMQELENRYWKAKPPATAKARVLCGFPPPAV